MIEKAVTVDVYVLFGLFFCFFPLLAKVTRLDSVVVSARFSRRLLQALFLAFACACFWFSHGADNPAIFIAITVTSLLFAVRAGRFDLLQCIVVFAALFTARTLPWWRQAEGPLYLTDAEVVQLFIAWCLIMVLLESRPIGWLRGRFPVASKAWLTRRSHALHLAACVVFAAASAVMSFSTAVLKYPHHVYVAWHHWGAFIAPAELMRAGAILFYDMPAQYGLGPSLAIAAVCGDDCWQHFHPLVASMTLVTALAAAVIAMKILPPKAGLVKTSVVLLAVFCCLFFWAAFPPRLALPTMAPSALGMRFMPLYLLVAYLLMVDRKIHAPLWRRIGHTLWLACALWAPESAFYSTFIWGPYYLWMQSIEWETPARRPNGYRMLRALLVLGGLLAITVVLFVAGFFAYYHRLPTWYGYLAYVLNSPGPLDLSVRGVIWVMAMCFLLSWLALWGALRRDPDTAQCRSLFVVLCAAFASTTIFVFRSLDENYLNIMPLQILMLLAASEVVSIPQLRRGAFALVACSIAFVPIFGWEIWADALRRIHSPEQFLESFETEPLTHAMSYCTDEGQAVLRAHLPAWMTGIDPEDARRAADYITATYHEPITMYDIYLLMSTGVEGAAWNGVQDYANIGSLPENRRREFLMRTARHLNKPGWFLVNKKFRTAPLLDDMDVAYQRTERLDFGTYYAIRYAPRAVTPGP